VQLDGDLEGTALTITKISKAKKAPKKN